ncbi:MAG: DUF4383 domain-containing protein [Thermoleophilaceae bacterium]
MARSNAQTYALLVGASLTVAGIVGFLYSGDFSTGHLTSAPSHRGAVLGILDVNGWHNLVHLLSGLAGLALWRSFGGARRYALGLGLLYTAVALAGIIAGDGKSLLGLLPVNTEDDVLHVAIALLGLVAGLSSPTTPLPSTASAQPGPGFRFD